MKGYFIIGVLVGAVACGITLGTNAMDTRVPTLTRPSDDIVISHAMDQYATAIACENDDYALLLAGQITEYFGTRFDGGNATKEGKDLREDVFQSIITEEWAGIAKPCDELDVRVLIEMMVLTDVQRGEKI